MLYSSAKDWTGSSTKRILLLGMSGLGKTHISNILRESGDWFHYSVDYRIGTRYMGEHIADNFKREAMQVPLLRQLLLSDSVYIASNITFDNLEPLSTYLGKPGDPKKGGLPFDEYIRRQEQHKAAEISALLDAPRFIDRAKELYGYTNFVCDSGGSICEVVDPDNADDPVLKALSENLLVVWIEGSDAHTDSLIQRFDKSPKPMYYHPRLLKSYWDEYTDDNNMLPHDVDPNSFVRWAYAKSLAHRQPLYRSMAENWGITVAAEDMNNVQTAIDFSALIASALDSDNNRS